MTLVKPDILLVDDEPSILFAFSRYLTRAGYNVMESSSLTEARGAIISRRFDAVILDIMLPDGRGIDWITELRANYPDIAIIVITGMGDIPLAVDAMRRGADNFLTKPVSLGDMDVFLKKSLELGALRREDLARQRLSETFQPYFGEGTAMKKVMELASLAAEKDAAVLLQGETGSGKGILAKWIYGHGLQKPGTFVEVNCSGLRGELLASELFGHVKGAFTSAVQDRQGLIEIADGGTLFLDEIGDMDLSVQPQFLKVIEEKQYRRLGDTRVRKSNFRLIAATNRDLIEETRRGSFRKDLFFRINIFPINIPSLRERPEDLQGFVLHFLRVLRSPHPQVSPEVISLLEAYSWPGNIRELRNVLERALLLARGRPLSAGHFPGLNLFDKRAEESPGEYRGLDYLEADHIRAVLERSGGDIRKAASALNISRATLYRKMKRLKKLK